MSNELGGIGRYCTRCNSREHDVSVCPHNLSKDKIIDTMSLKVNELQAEKSKAIELLEQLCDSVAVRTEGGLQEEWHRAMEYLTEFYR